MIQAFTETTFITYISTEDNRLDTSVASTQIRHLFKFINDMDGSIDYAYASTQTIYNRYTKFEFRYSTSPDIYTGLVNLIPAGHWKYEVYEVSWIGTVTLSEDNAPITETQVLSTAADTKGVVQGLVTKGILNLTEKSGTEQVQYTQREAPDSTNYIYYGQ